MPLPKISVIVPVYNAEKYLNRCIDSILAQTFGDFELLLVNDGSTDKSGSICDAYACQDSRVRVLHKVNGVSHRQEITVLTMLRVNGLYLLTVMIGLIHILLKRCLPKPWMRMQTL